jgi:hypothetical protein
VQKEKEQQKAEKRLKSELAGFGSVKAIKKSRNAFSVRSLLCIHPSFSNLHRSI